MNGSNAPSPRDTRFRAGSVAAEAILVVVIGFALSFLANKISPRGLALTTNFQAPGTSEAVPLSPGTNLASRLAEKGLHLMERAEAEKLFRDPRAQQNLILFIDARDEDHFAEGHIPGAMEFFPYHPEKYLSDVLPACQVADQVVVYCTGGDCEDSQSAALFLKQAGVPASKLSIYAGGITEWEEAKLPVERGARNSGDIHQ